MNKLVYVGVAIIVIIIVAAVALAYKGSPATTTVAATTAASGSGGTGNTSSSNATTAATVATTASKATTVAAAPSTTVPAGTVLCTPVNSTYSCSSVTYTYASNGSTVMTLTMEQKTGQEWSSFGVGYAPTGTKYLYGQPQIVWYSANYSSKANYGTSLQSGVPVVVRTDNGESGSSFGPVANGTIWACYTNSGLMYVGNQCQTNGGGSAVATYVKIGTITTT